MDERCRTCSEASLQLFQDQATASLAAGRTDLAVLVLPGSFNPVHRDHIRCLEVAKAKLEEHGWAVIGGLLQPSSDDYVVHKLGADWAMRLQDRADACALAAAEATDWVGVWRSGDANGSKATKRCEDFIRGRLDPHRHGARRVAFTVCGADFVERCARSRWACPSNPPKVVIARPGSALPAAAAGDGWHVARDEYAGGASSTQVREAIESGRWDEMIRAGWASEMLVDFLRTRHVQGRLFIASRGR